MSINNDQITRWANPPSETESERCTNAISDISEALRSHFGDRISFIRQGSHHNRTNIRLDSDVDLAVIHDATYFPDISALTPADKELHKSVSSPATYTFPQFKAEVYNVLREEFGGVERKNKCVRVGGSSTRVHADVVPAFPHTRYRSFGVSAAEGIGLITDDNQTIYSYPEQHYDNGIAKNESTSRRFKSVVRIFKNLRNDLKDKGLLRGGDMPSFFIECLIWNVPPDTFAGDRSYRDIALAVLDKVYDDMDNANVANDYAEVSDLKWLFRGNTPRTPARARDFMLQAWSHVTQ